MEIFLIDSCVLHSFINSRDVFHDACVAFLNGVPSEQLCFCSHTFFEVNASISRSQKNKEFESKLRLEFENVKYADITLDLFKTSRENGLFKKFHSLKGGDLIYACVAFLKDLTLVTTDGDFDLYTDEIKIKKLNLLKR